MKLMVGKSPSSGILLFMSFVTGTAAQAQWERQPAITNADLYDVKFVGDSSGWIVGYGEILKTTDAGSSWSIQTFAGKVFDECSFPSARHGWAVGGASFSGGNGIIASTTDGGDNWIMSDSSFQNTSQNYPNPFDNSTSIDFSISGARHVRLSVCDVLGRLVAVLEDETLLPGTYAVNFDAMNLSSGA